MFNRATHRYSNTTNRRTFAMMFITYNKVLTFALFSTVNTNHKQIFKYRLINIQKFEWEQKKMSNPFLCFQKQYYEYEWLHLETNNRPKIAHKKDHKIY